MESYTLICSQHGKCGFREDDWQIITRFSTSEELFEALKEGYLQDAGNRSNYPINGFPIDIQFTYSKLKGEGYTWLGNPNYYDDDENEDWIPDYRSYYFADGTDAEIREKFQDTIEKFYKWQKKIKSLLPILREKARIIKDRELEIANLFRLAKKHNYKLIKD